jgi:hypothetical protein
VHEGAAAHVAEGRIASELKQGQPGDEQGKEKRLIGQSLPIFQEFEAELFENSIARRTVDVRAYSRLLDTKSAPFAQSNSGRLRVVLFGETARRLQAVF